MSPPGLIYPSEIRIPLPYASSRVPGEPHTMSEPARRRLWPLLGRTVRFVLILSGVALWAVGAILWAFDASPLDGFDLRVGLSWTRVRTGADSPPVEARVRSTVGRP